MRQRKNKSRIKNKKRFYTILAIIFVILASGITYGAYTYNKLKNPQDLFEPTEKAWEEEEEEQIDINGQFDKNIINIMLIGFDKNEERSETSNLFRTDTNIVLTINLEEKTVDMVSIPRDSYVSIAHRGTGKDKFNSAFGYGYRYGGGVDKEEDGFKYTMDTASELLGGIPIYYYLAVDMDVVVEIVDAIGGVEMDVPIDLYKKNGKDRSRIKIEKGYQKLEGKDLLYYARYRHLPGGDIDRVANQQKILMSTFDSLKKSNKFTSLPKIYQSVQKNIKTNLNLNQLAALALFGKDMDKENIETHTMPGLYGTLNELSYWIMDQEKRVQLIEDIYGVTIPAGKQDPTEDKLVSLKASISKNILEIGEKAEITAKGMTSLEQEKMFDPGDLNYGTSNAKIAAVNKNGVVTATGPGNATITVGLGGISTQLNVTVNGPKDKTPPVISLIGNQTITINKGETFKDPGVKAKDDVDGDVTSRLVIAHAPEKVNTNKPGTYTITYNVSDKAGNAAKTVERTIIVKEKQPPQDKEAPVITLNGSASIQINQGDSYKDAGATAKDNVDGNISNKIVVSNPVDANKAGTYTITYSVSDKAGNTAKATRTVVVKPKKEVETPPDGQDDSKDPATP